VGGCRQLRWFFPPPVDLVRENAGQFTPPLCLEGLDLGGFVTLQNPKIIAVETDGDLEFQKYIGITGGVAPAPRSARELGLKLKTAASGRLFFCRKRTDPSHWLLFYSNCKKS
jgi:hypothetical protein